MLFAQSRPWPDAVDLLGLSLFMGGVAAIVAAGHYFLMLDVRRYVRSLRRTLVVVANYLPGIPSWARTQTPRCLLALRLRLPCSEADVLAAYREQVKRLHPDRGGDKQRFLQLQANFEESLAFVRQL